MLGPIKLFRGLRAIARITADPTRLEEVFVLADLAEDSPDYLETIEKLRREPEFAEAFSNRPRLGAVDLRALAKLPEGTVGRAYADFMREQGLDHEDLLLVEGESDGAWIRNHMRETHDLWHVATGFGTDVAGELGVQAFYMGLLTMPLPPLILAIGMLNTAFKSMDDGGRRLDAITRGWLLAKNATTLFGVDWTSRWEDSLEDFQREHGIDQASVDRLFATSDPTPNVAHAA